MKHRSNPLLRASRQAILTIAIGTVSGFAGTIWDGGGGGTTNINEALNWGGTVNAINGTTAATFATGGSTATMNVPARFTVVTFNRDDAAGFTVGGASALSVNHSAAGGTINLAVSGTTNGGPVTIDSPVQVYTTGAGSTRLLNIKNDEADIPAGSLIINGKLNASDATKNVAIRSGGSGVTVFNGTLSHVGAIQQVNSGTSSGKIIVNGNQSLGSATVNVPTTASGTVSSAYTIQMGASVADIQSWGSTAINQNATIIVNSTATLTGGVGIGGQAGATGATLVVDGALTSASTLGLGSAGVTGNLRIGGSASFSGAVSTGATAGNKIVGNAAGNGTLTLSSGSIDGASTTIGGGGTHEDNLNLVKQTSGVLNILGGTHSYTGTTTVNGGALNVSGSFASPFTVNTGAILNFNSAATTSSTITVNAGGAVGGEGTIGVGGALIFGSGNSTISFDPGSQTESLIAETVDVSAATAIVMSPTAGTTNGTPYVVLKRNTGTFSTNDLSKFILATRGGSIFLTGGNTEITLTPSSVASASLVWKGNLGSAWDVASTQNWANGGSPDRFFTGDAVSFDDNATSFTVALVGAVTPGNMVFSNTTGNDYTVSGGSISGSGSLTMGGTGLATIGSGLAHTGGLVVNSGILSLGTTNTNTFTGGIDLNDGELQFAGASILGSLNTQPVSLDGGGITFKGAATIVNDAQPFNITTNGSSINVDTTPSVTWRIGGVVSGSGNWSKSGAGTLALGKNGNTGPTGDTPSSPMTGSNFDGTVTVTAGVLDVRNPDSLGTAVGGTSVSNAVLEIFPYGQNQGVSIGEPLSLSGTSYFRSKNEDPDTGIINEWTGSVTVAASAVVGLGSPKFNAAEISKFIISGPVSTGTDSVLNLGNYSATVPSAIQEIAITGPLTGDTSVTARGAVGSVYTLSDPEYAGNTTVSSGKLSLGADNSSNDSSTVTIAATGATLELDFDESGGPVTDTVEKLFIGGVQQKAGVYKATDNVTDSGTGITQISGPGTLTVSSNPPNGFGSWMANNYPGIPDADNDPDDDFDKDGFDNLMEYALGLAPDTPNGSAGVLSGNTITFTKGTAAIANGDVHFIIETSTDLGASDPWTAAVTQNAPDSTTTIAYTFTPGSPVRNFTRLRAVLIP